MGYKKLFLSFLLTLFSGICFSQSSAELKKRKAALSKEIEALKREQKKIAGTKRLSLKQIDALNAQIRLREDKISTINSEIHLLSSEIREKTNTVKSLQEQLQDLKEEYAAMILFAQRNQNAYGKLMFVFAAENFNQAYKRLKYLQQFSQHRKRKAAEIQGTQKQLGIKIVELDQHKREKNSLLNSEVVEKVTLSKEKEEEAREVAQLSKKEKEVKQQVDKKKKQVTRINSAISAAIRREIAEERRRAIAAAKAAAAKAAAKKAAEERAAAARRAAAAAAGKPAPASPKPAEKPAESSSPSTNVLSSTPKTYKLSSGFLNNRGRLPWPVQGTVVSRYGLSNYGGVKVRNNGVDIKTAAGASVHAIYPGEVRQVLPDVSGYLVIIRHGEYFSVYSNLRAASVSKGQDVSAGQTIGSVKTNSEDGTTQLHLEIWNNTNPTNPEAWLAR